MNLTSARCHLQLILKWQKALARQASWWSRLGSVDEDAVGYFVSYMAGGAGGGWAVGDDLNGAVGGVAAYDCDRDVGQEAQAGSKAQ